MIFANGNLLPDSERKTLLAHLEEQINAVRLQEPLRAETVINAVDALGKRLSSGEFDSLLSQFLPANMTLDDLLPLLTRQAIEAKLTAEPSPAPLPALCPWGPSSTSPPAICRAFRSTPHWRGFSRAT